MPAIDVSAGTGRLSALDLAKDWSVRSTQVVASAGVLLMMVTAFLTLADAASRAMLSRSLVALNEVVLLSFSVAVVATIPAGLARQVDLKIDILGRWLTGWLAAWFDAFGALLLLGFYALLSWRLFVFALSEAIFTRKTMFLGLPVAPSVFASAVILAFGSIVQTVVLACAIRDALSDEPYAEPEKNRRPGPVFVAFYLAVAFIMLLLTLWGVVEFGAVSRWMNGHAMAGVLYAFLAMWVLMLAHIPLAALMGVIGVAGAALYIGVNPALGGFATATWGFISNPQVVTLPLFLMMGSFASVAGLAEDAYQLGNALLGRLRGGLALATITGCAAFGAMTGSSVATAATIGRVALPEMRRRGYSAALSTGVCAAGGTIGALVPPSSVLIIFALMADASVARLFIGALIPAVLAMALYMATVNIYVRIVPSAAPQRSRSDRGELRTALWRCRATGLLVLTVLGGLYLGIFTDTESAAAGALGSFIVAFCRGKLRGGALWRVFAQVTATTAMMYGIIFGANILSLFVGLTGLTEKSLALVNGFQLSPMMFIIVLLFGYLVMGSIVESWTILVLTVPFVTPIVTGMGFDITWWGILMACVVETGLIHPPFGINVFVLKSIVPDVPISTIYRGLIPFVVADLIKLGLLVAFPGLTLWLLTTM